MPHWPRQSCRPSFFYGNPRGADGFASPAWEAKLDLTHIQPPFRTADLMGGRAVQTITIHRACARNRSRCLKLAGTSGRAPARTRRRLTNGAHRAVRRHLQFPPASGEHDTVVDACLRLRHRSGTGAIPDGPRHANFLRRCVVTPSPLKAGSTCRGTACISRQLPFNKQGERHEQRYAGRDHPRGVLPPAIAYAVAKGLLPTGSYDAVVTGFVSLATALWSVHTNQTGKMPS